MNTNEMIFPDIEKLESSNKLAKKLASLGLEEADAIEVIQLAIGLSQEVSAAVVKIMVGGLSEFADVLDLEAKKYRADVGKSSQTELTEKSS